LFEQRGQRGTASSVPSIIGPQCRDAAIDSVNASDQAAMATLGKQQHEIPQKIWPYATANSNRMWGIRDNIKVSAFDFKRLTSAMAYRVTATGQVLWASPVAPRSTVLFNYR
jgi:hypothetical protein